MSDLDLNAAEVARLGGLERTFVSELLAGKKATIRRIYLEPLASALQCDKEWLTGEATISKHPAPPAFPGARVARTAEAVLDFIGTVENGVFRNHSVERRPSPVRADSRYIGLRQAAYHVAGEDLASVGIPAGSVVSTVDHDDYLERFGELRDGQLVVAVSTVRGVPGREVSLRRAFAGAGGIELRSPTANAAVPTVLVSTPDDASQPMQTAIAGVVTSVVQVID